MNVFLTGAIRTGKSSIINKFLHQTGLSAGGFRTCWQPDGADGEYLLLQPVAAGQTEDPDNRAAHRTKAGLTVYPAVFDRLGPALLEESGRYPLLIQDELGFMESNSPEFQAAVLRCLDAAVPVLGVIRARSTPFLNLIRNRSDVVILTVCPDNHDETMSRLFELFKELIK